MTDVETVTIALPREMAEDLRRVVETGEFASQDEAVQAALRDWRVHRDTFGYSIEELRALVDEGIASGPGSFSSIEEIKVEARRRWAASLPE